MRGATTAQVLVSREMIFQSTLLMRGATCSSTRRRLSMIFQSTLLMRGATIDALDRRAVRRVISIHAPHARSDQSSGPSRQSPPAYFNPRSSCEERPWYSSTMAKIVRFQSTLLMRGATLISAPSALFFTHFNPRSSCEERRPASSCMTTTVAFQSTLLMRGATRLARLVRLSKLFQSTLLMRGATSVSTRPSSALLFQSTLLMRGATFFFAVNLIEPILISIHAPHARSDPSVCFMILAVPNFNPRSSCEERPHFPCFAWQACYFNPRSSCEERLSS